MTPQNTDIKDYNKRIGSRIRLFREMRGMTQIELAKRLGYNSTGALSLIESGERGLNKVKLNQAASVLGTFQEVFTTETPLTQDQLIDMDKFLHIIKDKKHPQYLDLKKILSIAPPPKSLS